MSADRATQEDIPRLNVDLTTAFEERGRIAHGTTRVERELVCALAESRRSDLTFCRFDAAARRFVGVERAEIADIVRAPTFAESRREARAPWRRHPLLMAGRRLERLVRVHVRDRFRRRRRAIAERIMTPAEIFAPGEWLLIPGELPRQDFAVLMHLRRRFGMRLAFVLYDLLGTLTADDARARDPNAADVPSTEFIMREASLILSISHHSLSELRAHAAERRIVLPPVEVIRLGHRIEPAAAIGAAPPPDLVPGSFAITVGDVVPRKNHALLADVWLSLARERGPNIPPLLIIGRVGAEGASLAASVRGDPHGAAVRFLSNVDDATLRWLYQHCRFTLFPSMSEGFGLPVVESLASGKPCVASTAPALREASQGAAIHLDPADRNAWRETIGRLLEDDAELERQAEEIRRRFQPVAWRDTADDVLSAIASAARPSATLGISTSAGC